MCLQETRATSLSVPLRRPNSVEPVCGNCWEFYERTSRKMSLARAMRCLQLTDACGPEFMRTGRINAAYCAACRFKACSRFFLARPESPEPARQPADESSGEETGSVRSVSNSSSSTPSAPQTQRRPEWRGNLDLAGVSVAVTLPADAHPFFATHDAFLMQLVALHMVPLVGPSSTAVAVQGQDAAASLLLMQLYFTLASAGTCGVAMLDGATIILAPVAHQLSLFIL